MDKQKFLLNKENYYSQESCKIYMSNSQFKNAVGTYGIIGCEARMMAELNGEWQQEPSKDMLMGSYVDARFEGTIDEFMEEHPELFVTRGERKGELKAEFIKAEEIYQRCISDKVFSNYMSGEKQVIMTGEIEGVPFKIKMDSFLPELCITDLKIMQDLNKVFWVRDYGYMDFITYWGIDTQMAIYREIVRQNRAKELETYICAADKGKFTNIEVIYIDKTRLDECLENVKSNAPRIQAIKDGIYKPIRCEQCDYCKSTKILEHPIHFSDLIYDIGGI